MASVRDDAIARHGIDPDRIILSGFSVGGSMTAYLACAAPEAFAAYAPVEDINALSLVLKTLSFMPSFVIRFLGWAIAHPERFPGSIAVKLRQLNIGLRGLIVSLYFSGKTSATYQGKNPLDSIDFKLNRVPK